MILLLSDLMRYSISGSPADEVPVEQEVEMTRNYIKLQELRSGDEVQISYDVTGISDGIKIAPLIFLPLIENAFKHGVKGTDGKAFVDIGIHIEKSRLTLTVENSYSGFPGKKADSSSGIGLANVRKRLELIYPGRHTLHVEKSPDIYKLKLDLTLS
jgi:LytS/YehU family sensor histidine kinase